MTTFQLPLDRIDATILARLISERAHEGRQFDFKEKLPGTRDEDKREFLYDVTSFANGVGGDIIYGLQKRRDSEGRPTGEPGTVSGLPNANLDAEQLRLENLIRDGIDPRLSRVSFAVVRRDPEAPCRLIRVPRSIGGLHMVTLSNVSRFYGRNSAGKYQLDVHEIRAGFVGAETMYERARRFRVERVSRVLAGETPIQLGEGPKTIFHALSLDQSPEIWARFLATRESENPTTLTTLVNPANNWRFNADGFVVYRESRDPSMTGYTQLFRDGSIEAVSARVPAVDPRREGFYGEGIEIAVLNGLTNFQQLWNAIGIGGPVMLAVTLSSVLGLKILIGEWSPSNVDEKIGRDVLMIPETIVDDPMAPPDIGLRATFDMIWNAGGVRQSPFYREGRRLERQHL